MSIYQQGKIYKIECITSGRRYVGSTTGLLSTRLIKHKSAYKLFLNGKSTRFYSSFKALENNTYDIFLIEDFPCNSKLELEVRELHYITSLNNINKNHPTRSKICSHHRQRNQCKLCNGSSICIHNRRRATCLICSPVECRVCVSTHSKQTITCHLRSNKHKANLALVTDVVNFLEAF